MVALRSRWVLCVSMSACVAALLVALVVGARSDADDGGQAAVPSPIFSGPPTGGDVPSLRTERSRTYRTAEGRYQAQISAGPVNYRDADGDWQPIDTDLSSDGSGGFETTEAAARVSLPESLADPAKVTAGARWVSFALAGADEDVAPVADGASARYDEVLDGVDAAYDAQPTGVKETLTLADASAPASYRYTLDASSGLTPVLGENGTVAFRDAGGITRFWLPAPTVQEAGADGPTGEHIAYRLSEDRRTLTVVVDPDWLSGAAFPVQVDPSIWYGDATSCTLSSALPTIAACGGTSLKVGHDAAGRYRTALRYPDLATAVPRTASLMGAEMGLYFESQSLSTATTPVTVTGLGKLLGTGATWNKYDNISATPAHTWAAAGGDVVTDPQPALTTLYGSWTDGWVNFNISRLAERWLRSPSTNNGVLVRAQTETGTNNVITFDGHTWDHGGPTIRIDYEWHPGFESDQSFEQVAFDGTSRIAVNAATGNVAVDSTDIDVPGVGGLDLKVRRTFNGQDLGDGNGMFGSAWVEGINNAEFVNDRVWYDDSRTIYANGHGIYRFDRDPAHDTATTKAYFSPPNINADLVAVTATDVATLTFRDTGVKWTYGASFDGYHVALTKVSDAAGHHIDIAPRSTDPSKIATITDTNNTVYTFTYGTNNQLLKIGDGTREWKYTTTIVNTHNLLSGYTNPANQTTSYHYDATALPGTWDKLDRVTDHDGQIFSLVYGPQGDWSQLTQLKQDFTDSRPDNITNFDYKPTSTTGHACTTPVADAPYPDNAVFGRTVETDSAGHVTTYCYNTSAQVIQAWRPWDATPPAVLLSGAAYDARASGLTGDNYPLHVAATDERGTGVARIQILVDGTGRFDSGQQPCPAGTCPLSADFVVKVADLLDGADGSHTITVLATDVLGNVQTIPFAMYFNYGGRPDPYSSDLDDPVASDELDGATYPGDPCSADLPECHEPDDDDTADLAARTQGMSSSAAAAAASIPFYGLADQNGYGDFSAILDNTAFRALRVRRLRIAVPWDLMRRPQDASDPTNQASLAVFTNFYDAVHAYNATHTSKLLMLVSFDRHRGASNEPGAMPSFTPYKTAVGAFMDRFPEVKEFSAFNESNDSGHQLSNDPGTAAQLYRGLADVCAVKHCTHAVGGEFVDNQSYTQDYLRHYIDYLHDHGTPLPKIWAWHAYKAFTTSGVTKFRGFLQRIGHRDVWLTEQGGVQRKSGGYSNSEANANAHLQDILDLPTAANTSAIKRFYAYQWRGDLQYDAGLASRMDQAFATRSLYNTFKAVTNPSNAGPLS